MKIIDCFMYFNEDLVLDVRLNELNQAKDYLRKQTMFKKESYFKTYQI